MVAPDLIGFGRSDRPADLSDCTYERHVAWLGSWLTTVDLRETTRFCQDWGGLLGLRLVDAFSERFSPVITANTGLPEGSPQNDAFMQWLAFSQSTTDLPVGQLVEIGANRRLSREEVAAYDTPYPGASYKAGACPFPTPVPITPQHASAAENQAAWRVLSSFDMPFMTAFSDNDMVTKDWDLAFQNWIPGAKGQAHVTLKGGHFLQEDSPDDLETIIDGALIHKTGNVRRQALQGRAAVSTGAASGIGLELARPSAHAEMSVILSDIEAKPLARAGALLRVGGKLASAVRLKHFWCHRQIPSLNSECHEQD